MGRFVIAVYRAKPGMEPRLLECLRDHLPILRKEKLVTDRPPYFMRAADGAILEVFEWKSEQAVEAAHSNPRVLKLWERFEQCCTYERLNSIAEVGEMFPNFDSLEL